MATQLLSTEQVAAQLGVSEQWLANARWKKTGPKYVKLGPGTKAPVRYVAAEVEAYIDANRVDGVA